MADVRAATGRPSMHGCSPLTAPTRTVWDLIRSDTSKSDYLSYRQRPNISNLSARLILLGDDRYSKEKFMSQHTLDGVDHLKRSIDWKQGLAIALGVPLLILPSLGYLPTYVSAAAI